MSSFQLEKTDGQRCYFGDRKHNRADLATDVLERVNKFNLENAAVETVTETSK